MLNSDTGDLEIIIKKDANGLISGGLTIGDVQLQNQAILINMHPGELKEHPTVGVGISSMLLSSDTLLYKHKIREQLEADGLQINHLDIVKTDKINIEINANY